jgi:hypothetical protein
MQTPGPPTITLLILLPLILWRLYKRIRRMVGRQHLSRVRPWLTLTIFPLVILLLALSAVAHPERLLLLAGGIGIGVTLGLYGLKVTRFEATPEGLFYTPNAHLGIALSLLFVGRIVYRFFEIYAMQPSVPHGSADFARSPLTLAVFGVLAGYYITYAAGLLRWRFSIQRTKTQ